MRGLAGVQAIGNSLNAYDNIAQEKYFSAAFDILGAFGSLGQFFKACFAAGTPLRTPDGHKAIEAFQVGDLILSRPENDPTAPVTIRRVEEVFQTNAFLRVLKVAGHEIRTTPEHPFWLKDKGWTAANLLQAGDLIASNTDAWLTVENVSDTEEFTPVFNLRIAEDHTYFVGELGWGFAVWAHNTCTELVTENGLTTLRILNKFAVGSAESRQLQRFIRAWGEEISKAGGSMTRRVLSETEQRASAVWTASMREQFPARFADRVVGHIPDAAAGGAAVPDGAMALLLHVNSYLGGILRGITVGTVYNAVCLFR